MAAFDSAKWQGRWPITPLAIRYMRLPCGETIPENFLHRQDFVTFLQAENVL